MDTHGAIVSSVARTLWDTGESGKQEASTLLRVAGHHLDAVATAETLYRRLTSSGGQEVLAAIGGTSHAAEIVCIATVTQSGYTTLDLCAAATYRVFIAEGGPGGDREADLEDFRRKVRDRGCVLERAWDWMRRRHRTVPLLPQLPVPLQDWMKQVRSHHDWELLKDLRDKYTHAIVRRDSTIVIPSINLAARFGGNEDDPATNDPKVLPSPPAIGPGALHLSQGRRIDPINACPRIHAYLESQLELFIAALNASLVG